MTAAPGADEGTALAVREPADVGGTDTLDIRDARVAAAAIAGQSVRDIAAAEGVSERQAYRILAKPGVRAAIDRAGREMVRAAALVLRSGAIEAARTLTRFASGELAAPPAVRFAAAAKVAELVEDRRAVDELEERLEQLEARSASAEGWRR